jgi:hypothetical protein
MVFAIRTKFRLTRPDAIESGARPQPFEILFFFCILAVQAFIVIVVNDVCAQLLLIAAIGTVLAAVWVLSTAAAAAAWNQYTMYLYPYCIHLLLSPPSRTSMYWAAGLKLTKVVFDICVIVQSHKQYAEVVFTTRIRRMKLLVS